MCCNTFLPFTLSDSDDHALTVDIGDLQADRLRDAQSGSVAGRQNGAMLDIPHAVSGHYKPASNGRNDPATKICVSRHSSSKQARINSLMSGLFERTNAS